MRATFFAILFALSIVPLGSRLAGQEAAPAETRQPSARVIMGRLIEKYAGCESYRVQGNVQTVFHRAGNDRTTNRPFEAVFHRPDRFYFQFKSRHSEESTWKLYEILWNGETAVTLWSIKPGERQEQPLERAIGAATGVSGKSASRIAGLLLPEEMGLWGPIQLGSETFELQGKEPLQGRECYKIEFGGTRDKTTLWIDAQSMELLQEYSSHDFGDFRTEKTVTFEQEFDVEIKEEAFELRQKQES